MINEDGPDDGPGVVIFDEGGAVESISPGAESWIAEMVEVPAPRTPADSKMVQIVAARARELARGGDPLPLAARCRLADPLRPLAAALRHPALRRRRRAHRGDHPARRPQEVAPVVALAYGLTDRECQVAMQCVSGAVTKEIAQVLSWRAYTVQDHLKSIFDKTGVRSRGELVGQVFLDHYATRWQAPATTTPGLLVRSISPDLRRCP